MRKTLDDDLTYEALVARLRTVRADSTRRWGVMTAHEMLCHLGDAPGAPLHAGVPALLPTPMPRALLKWLALSGTAPWPRGKAQTSPKADPRREGTRPTDFARDQQRAIDGLAAIRGATTLCPAHPLFGPMSRDDWMAWAFLHTDHHLQQFGA